MDMNARMLAFKFRSGKSLEKKLDEIESREQAEEQIESINEKNPILANRLANSFWHDHLVRIGLRR